MGKLFVIDGTDGSGKQTQFNKLQEKLKEEGIDYKVVSFPNYESPSSSLVKMYLSGEFGKNAKEISPYIASTFYAADRYATFQTGYKEYYEKGGIILADRYTTANMVHQAGKIKDKEERKTPQIIYVGNNLSPNYISELIDLISNKDFSINVISKSGTTTEPAIAFRIFRELLEAKYDLEEARSRIYVTTDKKKGALKQLAEKENYETFIIPDNVGGRYSVLTPVGLLPIAVAGVDIDKLMKGARFAQDKYCDADLKYNECYQYAVARNILYKDDKNIEILANYEPKMHYVTEWWKQLYGESEGKDGKGIFPTGVDFTTDLHSLGQYIQEGRRNLFETVIRIEKPGSDISINLDEDDLDGLNYLVGKSLDFVNKKAMEGTIEAHVDGEVPNILITMQELNAETLGQLIYFFELACAMSGSILGVNPFNQPGVEKYKKNMFRLLGKPTKK